MVRTSAVGECAPTPLGGELGHFEGPKAESRAMQYVHDLHDSFLLSRPLPPDPRGAALLHNEEEEDQKEEDTIHMEMVREKYREMKRREKQKGILSGVSNRYARTMGTHQRPPASKATPSSLHPQQMPSQTSPLDDAPSDDPEAEIRELRFRIEMLQTQLHHQGEQTEGPELSRSSSRNQSDRRWSLSSLWKR